MEDTEEIEMTVTENEIGSSSVIGQKVLTQRIIDGGPLYTQNISAQGHKLNTKQNNTQRNEAFACGSKKDMNKGNQNGSR